MIDREAAYPHALSAETVMDKLHTQPIGLSQELAADRLALYGRNELPEKEPIRPLLIFAKQFRSWLIVVLLIAAAISWLAGQTLDTLVILAVVLVNAIIGFVQEYRAERAIDSLRKMIVKTAKVFRNGQLVTIPAGNVVPGDIMSLEEGDSIAADGRIVQSNNLRTVESSLTGESLPVSKNTDEGLPESTPIADRANMVWKGTFIAGGYARVVVTGTGVHTAIGEISTTLGEIEGKRSEFMRKTDVLARQMAVIAGISSTAIFVAGYFVRRFEIKEVLLTSMAALVAAVPEGLPAVISIVLAIGARRMTRKNAFVRDFTAIETLGAVTAILTDKTGTLTQNTLTARRLFISGEKDFTVTGEGWFPAGNFKQDEIITEPDKSKALQQVLRIAAASNNSEIRHNPKTGAFEIIGDPTEGALLVLAKKGGVDLKPLQDSKIDDLPFNSQKKLRATLLNEAGKNQLFVTGAPEKLLELSDSILTPNSEEKMDDILRVEVEQKIAEWSKGAMRVIALAYRSFNDNTIRHSGLKHLVFAGLVGMIDPPRPDAKEAVENCRKAGIRVVMLTGDHINTALSIARFTGIVEEHDGNEVQGLTESQLLRFNEDEFAEAVRTVSVFARLTPKMKLRIARQFQATGHSIAMTGDGVNDAPALKQANVGIAMGIMGTDVARDASDVVLADDNFATIVNAVREGRIVFTNSRQTSFFLVTTNIAESVTLVLTIALGLPIPLIATQILWLNLVTDSLPAIALASERGHSGIGTTQSHKKDENILNREILPFLLINVSIMSVLSLVTFKYYLPYNLEVARTGVFIVMAFAQLFNAYNLRSLKQSVFKVGFFSSSSINWSIGISILMLVLITEIPVIAELLHFASLSFEGFIVLFAASSTILWVTELYKLWINKTNK